MNKVKFFSVSVFFCLSLFSENINAYDEEGIVENYANIAFAVYEDSLLEALKLQKEVRRLINKPSEEQLTKTKQAWIASRIPYSQTEVFRFGNKLVDDWEGKVNAWPLDEGLIDYIIDAPESAGNAFATANAIANEQIELSGVSLSLKKLNVETVSSLHSVGDIETNVSTGYHAIEFLLWGQDLNGTKHGSGERSYKDFDRKNCTNGNCFRRGRFLLAVTDLLVKDLTWMTKQWQRSEKGEKFLFVHGKDTDTFSVGTARHQLEDMTESEALAAIVIGMGSLTFGELAGERIKLGLLLYDPEEEQDCFSDNTHNSHFNNVVGVRNIYTGAYKRINGDIVSGASLSQWLASTNKKQSMELSLKLEQTIETAKLIVDKAEIDNVHYDQLLDKDNVEGHALLQKMVDKLLSLTVSLSSMAKTLELEHVAFEGSDSLDNDKESDFFK